MADISINWATHVINVPQSYLTLVSGTLYEMDTNQFRLDLKALETTITGISHPKTHNHNTEVVIAGTTYARAIEILAPYSIEFEEGMYTVILKGSNNNIFDVGNGILVQNYVQVIPTNSSGLVVAGSGVTSQDKMDIISGVLDELIEDHTTEGSIAETIKNAEKNAKIAMLK